MVEIGKKKGRNREKKGNRIKNPDCTGAQAGYEAVHTFLWCYYLNVPGIILREKSFILELVEPHRWYKHPSGCDFMASKTVGITGFLF